MDDIGIDALPSTLAMSSRGVLASVLAAARNNGWKHSISTRSRSHFLVVTPIVVSVLLILAEFVTAPPVHADDPLTAKQLEVERQLGCPVCTNLPLNVCDNQICQQMKGVIHVQLAEGKSPDQVVDYFVSRYGEGILLTPRQQGFNLVVWYLPLLALIFGAAIVWAILRQSLLRQKLAQRRLAAADPSLSRYRRQVRSEIKMLSQDSPEAKRAGESRPPRSRHPRRARP